ncbi:CPBP family glutamic-type intramembrane protease [Anaerobacillus alkalidiazotrophicus]|uniref:CPBP family glutamic-type intramembrane protease n=1 Tax=Anaerobacillus alkalidiazotrophicus TaxID=472963 RepID=UPI001B804F45
MLNTILLVGIIEEIVFRGFLLRKLINTFIIWRTYANFDSHISDVLNAYFFICFFT